jgi:hypothetical protein
MTYAKSNRIESFTVSGYWLLWITEYNNIDLIQIRSSWLTSNKALHFGHSPWITKMKLHSIALTLFSVVRISTCNPEDEPFPFPVQPMGFSGVIGGHQVTLNGTIGEVYAQAKALYPDIDIPAERKQSPSLYPFIICHHWCSHKSHLHKLSSVFTSNLKTTLTHSSSIVATSNTRRFVLRTSVIHGKPPRRQKSTSSSTSCTTQTNAKSTHVFALVLLALVVHPSSCALSGTIALNHPADIYLDTSGILWTTASWIYSDKNGVLARCLTLIGELSSKFLTFVRRNSDTYGKVQCSC